MTMENNPQHQRTTSRPNECFLCGDYIEPEKFDPNDPFCESCNELIFKVAFKGLFENKN